ncbi:Fc receptor-like protein 5 [Anguilla rostrata]|uniref:Fc receptor-like protein 5 n=1 Tax=Anguilla rostrata TaxID=7938 RepID=UPI0030CCAA0B
MEDIGEYKVQNTDQNINTVFQLNVYIPVSKPHVSVTRDEYPCKLMCTVERGTEVTLSWYREGEEESYGSYPVRNAPHLDLPQTVDKGGIYTCEANNSVSRETSDPLTVGAHCTAVSVFGQSVELHGILGQSVKFPAAVKKGGSLMHSGVTIGDVTNGKFTTPPNERFNGRLHWDSSTGLFSLSGLKMEDIGEYKVQNTDQNINTVFQLNVYIPVSKPHITITHNEYPCTIVCTVERGTGVILSWYREGEKRYGSSDSLDAPYLKLPQTVETHGIYICEARNSVSNETSDPLTVGAHCTATGPPAIGANASPSGSSTGIIVASVIAVVAVLIAAVFAVLYCRKYQSHCFELWQ